MLVVFINIIFGIVIDTFSSLRALKMAKQENTINTCFICSIGRQTFDRADDQPDGYKRHIRNDHNMWAYLSFIFFLWEQDKDDDDGLEYVFCSMSFLSFLVCDISLSLSLSLLYSLRTLSDTT